MLVIKVFSQVNGLGIKNIADVRDVLEKAKATQHCVGLEKNMGDVPHVLAK